MKTVVTMTSWKARIDTVHIAIRAFMKYQTIKPDIFYLWLSDEEFPDHILPLKLTQIIDAYDVKLKWLTGNEYAFKRWHVYPEHYEDLVISIDDDRYYPKDTVEYAQNFIKDHPNDICNIFFHQCGYDIAYGIWMNTQCIIPPGVFPLKALEAHEKFKTCHSDEAIIFPFILKNDIRIQQSPKFLHHWLFTITQNEPMHLNEHFMNTKLKTFNEICQILHVKNYEKYNRIIY